MVADSTEEQQIEAIKNWINENGVSLAVSIVVVLAGLFGYNTWQTQTREAGESASAIYEELVEAVTVTGIEALSDEKLATSKFLANQLKQDYKDSTYALFAAMHLAKLAVENDDLPAAASELQWVMDQEPEAGLGIIANLRLAKVKYAQQQYDAALQQLDAMPPGSHAGSYEELRGDIYYAMERMDEAREAYQRAVAAQVEAPSPFTQMKLDDLIAPRTVVTMEEPSDSDEEN